MKNYIRFIFVLVLLISPLVNKTMYAPPPSPPAGATGGAGGPGCFPPPCVPIDGGISFLIAAGIAYGAKKTYDNRKSN